MRRFALLAVVALAACGGAETPADTTAAATPAPPPPPANLTAADVAGTWTVKGMNEAGDSTLITYDMVATNDTTGWAIVFSDGQRVPVTKTMLSGDSVVSDVGPFASKLRRGARVRSVRSVSRMQDGKLVGTTVVRYDTKAADSVLTMRTEGTRKTP